MVWYNVVWNIIVWYGIEYCLYMVGTHNCTVEPSRTSNIMARYVQDSCSMLYLIPLTYLRMMLAIIGPVY